MLAQSTWVRVAAALVVALVATACSSAPKTTGSTSNASVSIRRGPLNGTAIQTAYGLPGGTFTDTSGEEYVPGRQSKSGVTIVFFGYTHCPDVCNVVLANIAAALRRTDPDVRREVRMLFITTDPERDRPGVIRDYLDQFDSSFVGLTASLSTIRAAAASMNIAYEAPDSEKRDSYEVMHGTHVTGFVDGRARVLWRAETPVRALREDLAKLVTLD